MLLIIIPSLLVSSRYYECDDDVENDYELQNFMNEVSADGTGSDGGLGNVRRHQLSSYIKITFLN